MNAIKNALSYLAVAAVVILVVGLVFMYEYSMWEECRQTNSFWYCMRVLSK